MKTKIHTEGDVTIVELSGYLDFESANPLQRSIDDLYKTNQQARVVIDLRGLEFVGSSGVSSFVKTLKPFNSLKMKPFYFGVKNEFVRLFRAFEADMPFEVHVDKNAAFEAALQRYNAWQLANPRSKRTH